MDSDLTRRRFVEKTAQSLLGVSALTFPARSMAAKEKDKFVDNSKLPGFGKAERCIYLFMSGGMSHLDTFDPKESAGAEIMGTTDAIKTSLPGERSGSTIPNLAKLRDQYAVVRSLTQKTGDHQQGSYLMRTSYAKRPDIRHPSIGAWAQHLLGKNHETLPDSVTIGGGSAHPGRGFLAPEASPLPIHDPEGGVPYSKAFQSYRPQDQIDSEYTRRLDLLESLDAPFREKFTDPEVKAYTALYDEALKFMKSEELDVFDLSGESPEARARYGDSRFGQGCLLAKRLVSSGIRYVDVQHSGWDTHTDNFTRVGELAADLDRGLSALLQDLKTEGLLDTTLVVVATEFGRSPGINGNEGRDHHPGCFSGVLAGAGITGGGHYGKSDEKGHSPAEDAIEPKDFNATIAHSLGIDLNEVVYSPSGRPFTVAAHTSGSDGKVFSSGQVLSELFAG